MVAPELRWHLEPWEGNTTKEKVTMARVWDPVCGAQCEESQAVGRSEYRGETYYFCDPGCKQQFDANPDAFVGNVWGPDKLPPDNVRHPQNPPR